MFYGLSITMKKPGNYLASGPLQRFGAFELLFYDLPQPGGEREISALVIFRLTRIEPQPAAPQSAWCLWRVIISS
jgi:hypothetical protein